MKFKYLNPQQAKYLTENVVGTNGELGTLLSRFDGQAELVRQISYVLDNPSFGHSGHFSFHLAPKERTEKTVGMIDDMAHVLRDRIHHLREQMVVNREQARVMEHKVKDVVNERKATYAKWIDVSHAYLEKAGAGFVGEGI